MARILLIDNARVCKRFEAPNPRGRGHEVAGTSRDGYEGIENCKQLNPDLVILDVIMPRICGLEYLRGIWNIDPQAKILVISGDGREEHVSGSLSEGHRAVSRSPI
jgi:two-component system, chemotaxis family, chemotaxis protein CheY